MGTLNLAWWNLGNFFNTDDDPISNDLEFTAEHGWTQQVFEAKRKNLADGLKTIFPNESIDILAVCEIEKDEMLSDLIAIMGDNLTVAVDPNGTSDLRGIDVAVAYNPAKLKLEKMTTYNVYLRYPTRDLFEVEFSVLETHERFTVIACHWPSRSRGRYESEPARITVAENVAYIIGNQVKATPGAYEALRQVNELKPIQDKWESKIIVVGDFNDEPTDRSVVGHLNASGDLDRVIGETNDIDGFKEQVSSYRGQPVYLYNATWKLLGVDQLGSYFFDQEGVPNRYQLLDQLVVSRGLVTGNGLTLDRNSVQIVRNETLATQTGRPKKFEKRNNQYTLKGYSDHLPLKAVLHYEDV
jgi:hypothetical protein